MTPGTSTQQSSAGVPAAMICPGCQARYEGALLFCPTDGTRLIDAGTVRMERPESPLVGTVLADRYRILRKIGEGGMGEVFEAQHVYIDKKFAIKTLRAEITSNPEAVQRFHQEARSASIIGHENIVEIGDFGRLPDGSVYLAMEFLDGVSLSDRLKKGPPLSMQQGLDVMEQVCRGLAAAHAKGIIHRDMKPENIHLVDKGGKLLAKILDFGIAKMTSGTTGQSLTQTGAIFGTPYYMSPEQALGHSQDLRSDVYSVGVILYELFSGRVPFEGESFMGILSQHITKPPVPPSKAAPERMIPPGLERVILKAMSKEAGDRHADMTALLEDLQRVEHSLWEAPPEGEGPRLELDRSEPAAAEELKPAGGGAGRLVAVALLALVFAGGVGALVVHPTPRPPPNDGPALTEKPSLAPAPQVPSSIAAPSSYAEVVVESIPTGAKIIADGKIMGETPDVVKVPVGAHLEIILRKEGYVARQVMLDPVHGHKEVVKLDRERRGSDRSGSSSPQWPPPLILTEPEHKPAHGKTVAPTEPPPPAPPPRVEQPEPPVVPPPVPPPDPVHLQPPVRPAVQPPPPEDPYTIMPAPPRRPAQPMLGPRPALKSYGR